MCFSLLRVSTPLTMCTCVHVMTILPCIDGTRPRGRQLRRCCPRPCMGPGVGKEGRGWCTGRPWSLQPGPGHPPIHPVHWYHRLLEPRLPAALPQAWQPRVLHTLPCSQVAGYIPRWSTHPQLKASRTVGVSYNGSTRALGARNRGSIPRTPPPQQWEPVTGTPAAVTTVWCTGYHACL